MNHEQVKGAFNEYCRNFMVNDIQRCINDAKANLVVALALSAYIEVLGVFINKTGGETTNSAKDFGAAIDRLPKHYADLNKRLTIVNEKGKIVHQDDRGLYSAFRCGLVHEYTPKGDAIVMSNPDLAPDPKKFGLDLEPYNGGHRLVINNNELFRDFRSLLAEIGKEVDAGNGPLYDGVKKFFEETGKYRIQLKS